MLKGNCGSKGGEGRPTLVSPRNGPKPAEWPNTNNNQTGVCFSVVYV